VFHTFVAQLNTMKFKFITLAFLVTFSAYAQIKNPNANFKDDSSIDSTTSNIDYLVSLTPAESVGANQLWTGGSTGLDVDGSTIYVGQWEAGSNTKIDASHLDLSGRVSGGQSGGNSSHATDVALVLAGSGNTTTKGVAHQANLISYDIDSRFTEMTAIAYPAANGILVSNHSYSGTAGWYSGGTPTWYGVKEISTTEDHKFGRYGSTGEGLYDEDYDETASGKEYLTVVKAAGNEKEELGSAPYSRWAYNGGAWNIESGINLPVPEKDGGTDYYDCIPSGAMGKNVLTIGACQNLNSPYVSPSPSDIILQTSSGWGPSDDGRIKPDLVAPGSLTSFSTPVVSGVVALLQEAYFNKHSVYMTSATARGLLCHTAFEAGVTIGPDYQHGWGMVNAEKAGLTIKNSSNTDLIKELTLTNGATNYFYLYASADGTEAKLSISWTDVEGTPTTLVYAPSDLNKNTAMLINDLDLRLTKVCDSTIYSPYLLDATNPSAAATKGDNIVDNLEIVEETLDKGWYVVEVSHKGTLDGSNPQSYTLISTGLTIPVIYNGAWSSAPMSFLLKQIIPFQPQPQ